MIVYELSVVREAMSVGADLMNSSISLLGKLCRGTQRPEICAEGRKSVTVTPLIVVHTVTLLHR